MCAHDTHSSPGSHSQAEPVSNTTGNSMPLAVTYPTYCTHAKAYVLVVRARVHVRVM